MKQLIKIIMIIYIILFGILTNNNITHWYAKKDIYWILNTEIQKQIPEKKLQILDKIKETNFIEQKLSGMYLNSYTYSTIKSKIYNNYSIIIDSNNINYLYFDYNKYRILEPNLLYSQKEELREYIIKQMLDKNILNINNEIKWYDINIDKNWNVTYAKLKDIVGKDNNLDLYIDNIFSDKLSQLEKVSNNSNVNIYYNYLKDNNFKDNINLVIDLNNFKNSIIFRNTDDLYNLLKVSSYRYREWYKNDREYRQFNIKTIYDTIEWNNYVLYPWKQLSFNDIYVKNDNWKKYKSWAAIIDWKEEKNIYGGGVCGAATGMYQWTLFNSNIIPSSRNHSFWYNWYNANINGTYITTPWLDSTYFSNSVDLKLKNNWKYPIILVNKVIEKVEYNFSLSFKFENNHIIKNLEFVNEKWKCYTWNIDWYKKTSCYTRVTK